MTLFWFLVEDKKLIEKRYKLLESIKSILGTASLVSMLYAWYYDGFQLYSIYPLIVMAVFLPGHSIETIISVVASSLGNTGPALGSFGSTDNWSSMNTPALLWTSVLMWLGRLELLTALILLHPRTWRNEEREVGTDKASLRFFRKLFKRMD